MFDYKIPFNKPYLSGKEIDYIHQAVYSGKISGNGVFTKKCQEFFERKYGFKKVLLTTSCTDALEMCAILANIKEGDEVIVPSYTFVSTALAFIRQGAKIIFADSQNENPNIDYSKLENLITAKTKAIVPVHYAGVACDMDKIMAIATKFNLIVIEDAAQSIDSYYNGKPLGSIGHMSAFSFHETKNINSGEGGMIAINDAKYINRSEIIWEKGTNRAEFFRGEINKYGWVDIGSSFLPSEVLAAYLWAQLENIDIIQNKRISIWNKYYNKLKDIKLSHNISLPSIPEYSTNNGHMFYLICDTNNQRTKLINHLKEKGIYAVFHYISLNKSAFYLETNKLHDLPNADRYTDLLIRLPMYFELTDDEIEYICQAILEFNGK